MVRFSKGLNQEVSDARKLKDLEDENRRLKRLVADLSLDNQMFKAVNEKNGEPQCQARRRRLADGVLFCQPTAPVGRFIWAYRRVDTVVAKLTEVCSDKGFARWQKSDRAGATVSYTPCSGVKAS